LLSGQIADGIATNFVGLLIDKTNTSIGKRTPWFIAGSLLVIPSFILTFNTCFLAEYVWGTDWETTGAWDAETHKLITYVYYITLPALFNIGWAAVQISTMSIVVAITYDQKQRDTLISYRNACTFGSNLVTLTIALVLFDNINNAVAQFRILAIVITVIGLSTSAIYIIGWPENKLSERAITHGLKHAQWSVNAAGNDVEDWRDWLKSKQFYAYCMVYTLTRLSINVTMSLTPFYLIIVLEYCECQNEPTPPEIASVPLVSYLSSMIFTLLFSHKFKNVFNENNRIMTLAVGFILVGVSSIPFLFMTFKYGYLVYICVPIQGIGLAIGLNVSGSLMSDMIGHNSKSSAFVYGTYSLVDKFTSGLILVLIGSTVIEHGLSLRFLAGVLPIVSSTLAWLFAYLGQNHDYTELKNL
jgi:Na+/melibiose symporter-like transporter